MSLAEVDVRLAVSVNHVLQAGECIASAELTIAVESGLNPSGNTDRPY
jgi:hypothetical protein